MIAILIYAISFLISFLMLVVVLFKRKIYDAYYLMLNVTIFLCNLGYLLLSLSKTLEEAILANKISYLCCFLPYFMFMVVTKVCKIKIPRWVSLLLVGFSIAIYGCILTTGFSPIYYRSIELKFEYNAAYLVKTYGFAHTLYNIMIYGYLIANFVIIFISSKRKEVVSHKIVLYLGILAISTCDIYLFRNLMPAAIELMPIIYAINCVVLVYVLDISDMYDATIGMIKSREENNHSGYLIFNSKKEYCGADNFVKEIYPELSSFYIDSIVQKTDSRFCNSILEWFYANLDNQKEVSKIIEVNDKYYKVTLFLLKEKNESKLKWYLIEFSDVTNEQKYIKMIDDYNERLEEDVKEKTASILNMQQKIILGFASIVESRDNSTGGHIIRTREVVSIFSKKLLEKNRFSKNFLEMLIKAAPMHDLGKVAVDDRILRKQGKYTEDEFEEMKKHTTLGAGIVKKILDGIESPEFVEITTNVAHYHHERYNGTGYPTGLKGNEIPVEARLMALADVFDALVSKRCYKEAFSYDKAISIIKESLGEHFDPELGEIFIECKDDLINYYDSIKESN